MDISQSSIIQLWKAFCHYCLGNVQRIEVQGLDCQIVEYLLSQLIYVHPRMRY